MRIQEFDFSVNLLQAILWQYNKASKIQQLITLKQSWYDIEQSEFWQNWYRDVFNLITANDFGLSVWSIILNIPLFINTDPQNSGPIFGFNEDPSINNYVNFNNGNFSSLGTVTILSTEEQRLLLRLRYYQLISRGAIPEINTFLNNLFQTSGVPFSGHAWVLDGFDMTMTYVFDFYLPKIMRTVLQELDLLPRPAGVGLKYIILTGTVFGFGLNNQNFENGNFMPSSFLN